MPCTITEYLPELAAELPATAALLRQSTLVLHDAVRQVTLLGSRGLAGGAHPASDIDLSLMVDPAQLPSTEPQRAQLLQAVLATTLSAWQSPVEIDLAAVFDQASSFDAGCCGMRCFSLRAWDDAVIRGRGVDCFGIYKIQRGFNGYVTTGVRLDQMLPLLPIWRSAKSEGVSWE